MSFSRLPLVPALRSVLLAAVLSSAWSGPVFPQVATDCRAGSGDARQILARGIASTGLERLGRPALGLKLSEMVSQDYQSDRAYPPYLQEGRHSTYWYYPEHGLETTIGTGLNPFGERRLFPAWSTARGTWIRRDSVLQPVPPLHPFTLQSRPLNAWAVLADWAGDPSVRVTGRCTVRDFPRVRLARTGSLAEEHLYLDPSSGLPVQYELEVNDFSGLWGRQLVAYVYSNWVKVGEAQYPMASFRLVDGEVNVTRVAAPLPADSVPPAAPAITDTTDMRQVSTPPSPAPDTVRVAANTWLLRTRFYTNVVTLVRDTVFILDAQYTGEERARQDSTWIAKLFPGRHPLVLVVSDLAWPHIAGVRSWVAMGATVVAHQSTKAFLTRVVEHRWTAAPDLLEKRRGRARFTFVAVNDSLALAGGAVRVYPINGIGSEGSLMTWIPGERFLYAGDYVQGLTGPSMAYAAEVAAAAERVRATPERFAAMHMGLTAWADLQKALQASASPPAMGTD